MENGAANFISFEWNGVEVQLKPSFDLYAQVESRVSFARLLEFFQAGAGGIIDVPMSHVAWVVFCCVRHANLPIDSPMDALRACLPGGGFVWGALLIRLCNAFYGATPQKIPTKAASSKKQKPARKESKPRH